MNVIAEKIKAIKEFQSQRDQILLALVKDRSGVVVLMNQDQLYDGFDGNGDQIAPRYRPSTIATKKRKGQPYNRVTLKDEGDYHESLFIEFGEDYFELKSRDEKRVYLERKYGNTIYGLIEENLNALIEDIEDDFINAFRQKALE